jgi:hypothetical protein
MHLLNNVPPINAKIALLVSEIDPWLHYSADIYNDAGEVIGQKDEDTARHERKELEGTVRFRVVLIHNEDQMGLLSPSVPKTAAQHALGSVLARAAEALTKRLIAC